MKITWGKDWFHLNTLSLSITPSTLFERVIIRLYFICKSNKFSQEAFAKVFVIGFYKGVWRVWINSTSNFT